MNLQEVIKAGRSGFVYTAISITFAMLLGTLLGWLLSVRARPAFLISTGKSIIASASRASGLNANGASPCRYPTLRRRDRNAA